MKNSYLKTTGEWRETENLMGSSHSGGNCAEKVSYFCCYNLAADKAVGTLCWWTITIQVLSQGNWSHWRKRWESQKGRGSNHQVLSAHISAQALDHRCVVQILVTQLKTENLNWDWSCCPLSVICTVYPPEMGFPGDLVVKNLPAKKKNLPANAGDLGSIPRSGRSPGEGNGNPLQYSCLGNPTDRGAWRAIVHRVKKEPERT